ncbi:hypothetical protein CRUP_029601, partial [Coryphaenoides rupestris]
PAKVPILPKDILNSRKALAVRKEQKRKQGKQRSLGSPLDYSPLPIDKHGPEFVRVPHSSLLSRFMRLTDRVVLKGRYVG